MPRLIVEDFSCIDSADVELKRVTVLIGPQASGKSVVSKLLYFFAEIFGDIHGYAEESNSFRSFQREIARSFCQWFPPAAWGPKQFQIAYNAGPVRFKIERKKSGKTLSDDVSFECSDDFRLVYETALQLYRKAASTAQQDDEFSGVVPSNDVFQVRRAIIRIFEKELGQDYPSGQYFVPAGRSFYTNLGKAVAIIEHGIHVDAITKEFGRLFTSLLDNRFRVYLGDKPPSEVKDFIKHQKLISDEIFGGEMKLSRNDMHVATRDGRKIPLSSLSSGQQELLPLILYLQFFSASLARRRGSTSRQYLFVEEPEAHLFPAAQALLTKHLMEIAKFGSGNGYLLITTHSPYVLATINNLIQAQIVATASEEKFDAVDKVVSKLAWVSPDHVAAYAIEERAVHPINDIRSGLINANYIDFISNDISEEFMKLLEIESEA